MLDELLSLALVGTAHGGGGAAALPAQLAEAADIAKGLSAEHALLSRVALFDAYLRAGVKPSTSVRRSNSTAQEDDIPACSQRAADLLTDLLRNREMELVAEWLSFARSARQRAPHRLLPDLLNSAVKETSLRHAVVSVIGERGRWLMAENPDWNFTIDDSLPSEQQWETGTLPQRLLLLRKMREKDPSQSRELLKKTWKDDPADQRVEFLKVFIIGLSLADEPMLESALDDRSKTVRAVAADLLGRLPKSEFVKRMIARVSPLLEFKRGLLKSAKLVVTLPTELDPSAQRDIVEKTAPQGTGEKQWWLGQMLSLVPLSSWTTASGMSPSDIISIAAKTDFGETLVTGFNAAAQRQPNASWIEPLLRHELAQNGRLSRLLLNALPSQQFFELACELLREKRIGLTACSDLINNKNIALDLVAGRLWIQTVATLIERGGREEVSILYHLPGQCVMRLPPILRAEIESLWNVEREPWNQYRSNIEKMLKVMETRAEIEKEFS